MTTAREIAAAALGDPNVQAFLRVIRSGETNQEDVAYRTVVGGGTFDSFDAHPGRLVHVPSLKVSSTAAGAYQFLKRTWAECAEALELTDFSPASQDLGAVFLIRRRGALSDVIAGRLDVAVQKCAKEWASLPGSPYGQPVKTMEQVRAVYERYGGQYAAAPQAPEAEVPAQAPEAEAPPQPVKEKKMAFPAVLMALLPTLIEQIPRLGKIFGSGSAVAERNVAAATTVMELVKTATGAANAQAAVEAIASDPAARAQAEQAIEQNWFTLTEGGSGGIDGAAKRDMAVMVSGESVWKSPSFIVAIALLPLVYMIVGAVVGLFGAPFSDDVRSAIANGIVGLILGGLIGYYYGQSTSRNRPPTT